VGTPKLTAALDTTLADSRYGAVAANTCLVVQAGPVTVYQHNPTMPLVPASNLKLLTATAAMDKLPAADHLATTVKGDTAPSKGTVTGNLYLVGGGDPLLRTPDYVASLRYPEMIYDNLETLADQVKAAGVTQVTGSVVGDDSRYDGQRSVSSWPSRYLTDGEVGPLSALSVNDGFAAFTPSLVPAPQPAQQAAATFAALLRARGVTITGGAAAGTAPAGAAKITELDSAPIPEVVDEILRRSDNNGAELITKELGRQANPATPTTAAGLAVIQSALQADGLPMAGLHMVDGSGLDRTDRATCGLIVAALVRSGPDGALGRGLAVAGSNGTLFKRMIGTPAAGRLRAKTGSLEGVAALSGFVTPAAATPSEAKSGSGAATTPAPGTTVAFSLITNAAPNMATGDALGDRVGVLLAQFPQAPPIATLAPLTTP
jgi:D-alanyl-D-alanine carboxypeptidase/D-alanyl-D-alanine-endopeptidase (penicillin-binding protein 4)